MSSWEEIIGLYPTLKQVKTQNKITGFLYKTILKKRSNILADCRTLDSQYEDPHYKFLSFEEEKKMSDCTDKKNKPSFTYKGDVPVTEEVVVDGAKKKKVTGKVEGDKKKGKWITMSVDIKYALVWWLSRYAKEIQDFYNSRDGVLPETSDVIAEFVEFTSDPEDYIACISPFICSVTDKIDVSKIMPETFEDLGAYIHKLFATIFKNETGTPSAQLGKLVDRWVNFLKIVAIQMAGGLWHVKRQGNVAMFFTVLRNLITVTDGDAELEETSFQHIMEYIQTRKDLDAAEKEKKKLEKDTKDSETPASLEADEDAFSTLMDGDGDDQSFDLADATEEFGEASWADETEFDDI